MALLVKLEAPLHFLKLAALRARQGALVSKNAAGQTSVISKVPVEIWQAIEHELGGIEPKSWRDMCPTPGGCDDCVWEREMWSFFRDFWSDSKSKALEKLLSAFGLQLLTKGLIKTQNSFEMDFECATPVVLKDSTTITTQVMWGGEGREDENAVIAVPSSVPADARHRFLSLVKLLRLEVVRIVDTSAEKRAFDALPKAEQKEVKNPPRERRFDELKMGEVEPGWLVHSTCKGDW
ncbi:hypothetical protein JCM10450v2_001300 [Rhodotorula kratochvilovae]